MNSTGPVDHDDDGNTVPVPPVDSDLAQLIQLLEYGRKRGFQIGPAIRVGSIVTQVRDLRQKEGGPELPPDDGGWMASVGMGEGER